MALRARLLDNLVKELGLASAHAPQPRSPAIHLYAQKLIETLPDDKVERAAEDVTLFVRSTRLHKELLERYQPKDGLTVEERTRMTANRVGLNIPKEYKEGDSDV